jgi:hypothetical protein
MAAEVALKDADGWFLFESERRHQKNLRKIKKSLREEKSGVGVTSVFCFSMKVSIETLLRNVSRFPLREALCDFSGISRNAKMEKHKAEPECRWRSIPATQHRR